MAPPWPITGAVELVNTVNNLVFMSEHNTWVIMAPWRPREVKNSENEQKWPFWTKIRYFLVWYERDIIVAGAVELVNTVNNLVFTSEHNTWVITALWRPREVKNSENEQKWPFWAKIRYFPLLFRYTMAPRKPNRYCRAGKHRKQLDFHVWAQHMGHNGPLAAERGQKQWKWAKMTILDQNPLLFGVIWAWYYRYRCCRAGKHRKQLGFHVWAQHMGHKGPLAAEKGQKQWKWAKMTILDQNPLLFRYFSVTQWPRENRKSQFDPTTAPKGTSTNSDPKLVAQTAF